MQGFEEIRVHVASLLAEIYLQMKQVDLSKNILKQELDMSRSFSFWHCRILFQMAVLFEFRIVGPWISSVSFRTFVR